MGQEHKDKIGRIQKTLHSWWRRKVAYPVRPIDDYVKHDGEERPELQRKGKECTERRMRGESFKFGRRGPLHERV